MQARNANQCKTTEYHSYQRARRTDAEPITRKAIPLWLSAFFISIYDDSLPRPTGKEKNRCRAGCFRALNIHIPAAVLRNQNRRNSLPGATTVRRLVEETAMLQQSVFLKNSFLKKVCPQYGIGLGKNMYDTM